MKSRVFTGHHTPLFRPTQRPRRKHRSALPKDQEESKSLSCQAEQNAYDEVKLGYLPKAIPSQARLWMSILENGVCGRAIHVYVSMPTDFLAGHRTLLCLHVHRRFYQGGEAPLPPSLHISMASGQDSWRTTLLSHTFPGDESQ